jgi:hypothetical protein
VGHYPHIFLYNLAPINRPTRLARLEKDNEHMGMRFVDLLLALWKVINEGPRFYITLLWRIHSMWGKKGALFNEKGKGTRIRNPCFHRNIQ